MGMYTELVLAVELKEETPDSVIDVLKYLTGDTDEHTPVPESATGHALFETSRWQWVFGSDSYYFDGQPSTVFEFDSIAEAWFLTTRFNMKNYDQEIQKFLDWLGPWIATEGFIGTYRYEESYVPTLLFAQGNNQVTWLWPEQDFKITNKNFVPQEY